MNNKTPLAVAVVEMEDAIMRLELLNIKELAEGLDTVEAVEAYALAAKCKEAWKNYPCLYQITLEKVQRQLGRTVNKRGIR